MFLSISARIGELVAQIPAALQVFEDVAHVPSLDDSGALKLWQLIGLSKIAEDQSSSNTSVNAPSLYQHTFRSEATSDEDVQIQPSVAGLSMPWGDIQYELGGFSSFDWSFLPNMDIPIFDYDISNPIIES